MSTESTILPLLAFITGVVTFLAGLLLGWKFGRESNAQPMFSYVPGTPAAQKDDPMDERTPWDMAQADAEEHIS